MHVLPNSIVLLYNNSRLYDAGAVYDMCQYLPLHRIFTTMQPNLRLDFLKQLCVVIVVVVVILLPSDGGMAEDHRAPEARQLPRAWTRGRRETDSRQKASGAKSL